MQHPEPVTHGLDGHGWHRLVPALALLAALWGCALPAPPLQPPPEPPAAPPPPAPVVVATAPDPAPAPVVVVPLPPMATADELLAYAESTRALAAPELAQEIARLGEPGESAPRMMRLAIALGIARGSVNSVRAQALLQRVLAQNTAEAQALHPLARLLLAQQADLRRSDEQLERLAQQLREAQRRIEQLNDRLEAVRAIERSLPSRPASAPSNGQRP